MPSKGESPVTSLQPIREIDEVRFFEIATSSHVTSRLPDWQMTMTYARRLAAHSRAAMQTSPASATTRKAL